jgi:hypothetical protein
MDPSTPAGRIPAGWAVAGWTAARRIPAGWAVAGWTAAGRMAREMVTKRRSVARAVAVVHLGEAVVGDGTGMAVEQKRSVQDCARLASMPSATQAARASSTSPWRKVDR